MIQLLPDLHLHSYVCYYYGIFVHITIVAIVEDVKHLLSIHSHI